MTTGLDAFDKTVQETNLWLKDLMGRLALENRHLAYRILAVTLQSVRDRVGAENAVHLGAQLPMLVRGFYFEGWHMAATPTKERHTADFLAKVEAGLPATAAVDPESAVRAVFEVMCDHLDPGETRSSSSCFPPSCRKLGRVPGRGV